MDVTMGLAWVIGVVPLLGWLLWWWNDLWYGIPAKIRCSAGGTKLPPGHMGIPFFGEMLTFLWNFHFLRRPDDYINSKRRRYGDGVGMFRTHLFGSPGIIICSPSINKIVFQSSNNFILEWPTIEILGTKSMVAVQGTPHIRMKSFVSRAINQPNALRQIAIMIQPRVIAALQSWAQKGRIVALNEAKKVTFENIGKFFVSFEAGPVLETLDELYDGVLKGLRAYPINFPGTAYHYALQCRKRAMAIFREELEKRKKEKNQDGAKIRNDLMDGLMQFEDDEGKQLCDIEVLDNIFGFLLGGYGTTAMAIMWALYYLAKYPNVLQKLREENIDISKNKNGELITSDDVSKMKYTNKVVEETIRLANVATMVFRKATNDVEFEGYRIPKNWQVFLWIRYLHTNPENFEDPMCFNPDRWNEPAKPGTYQVFGGGPRSCPGNKLVRLQLAIFLHHLSVGYKWDLINPEAKICYRSHPKPVDGVEIAFSKI